METFGIEGDSEEYTILRNAAANIAGVEGLTCEIGVRLGLGSVTIMQETAREGSPRIHVGVDPFGNIRYPHGDYCRCPSCASGWKDSPANYTNSLKRRFLKSIYAWCEMSGAEFLFFPLEDVEYFDKFSEGVPTYSHDKSVNDDNYKENRGFKKIIDKYALVHIDGPHDLATVQKETDFFIGRISTGGYIVYDDVADYDHHLIDAQLLESGYECVERGQRKISYKRKL